MLENVFLVLPGHLSPETLGFYQHWKVFNRLIAGTCNQNARCVSVPDGGITKRCGGWDRDRPANAPRANHCVVSLVIKARLPSH